MAADVLKTFFPTVRSGENTGAKEACTLRGWGSEYTIASLLYTGNVIV
jgi:hypothetical protein